MSKLAVIIALLIVIYLLTLREVPLKDINNLSSGELVRVRGKIISYSQREKNSFIVLKGKSKNLSVVFFKRIPAFVGENVEIKGRVKTYKGREEMIGVELKSLN